MVISPICDFSDMCQYSSGDSMNHLHVITPDQVVAAVTSLKAGRRDGVADIYSDGIIQGTPKLFILLSQIFTLFLPHGTTSDLFINGTMIPLPKVKGTGKSEEFRAITLSSVTCIGKLFDIILLNYFQEKLQTSPLQFGFKEGSSTTACTFAVIKETIAYFNIHNTPVICTLLDACKAFDTLEYCKLFDKLRQRNIYLIVIRLLICMYLSQQLCVRWNSQVSNSFGVTNGVKQGGVLSLGLFCIYINDLLHLLGKKYVGCFLRSHFAGAFAYADDIIYNLSVS